MNDVQPAPANETRLWALLIGIDYYKELTNLRGCVNDVEAWRVLLANSYGVPEERIRVLINKDATRANILKTFQEFLIDNPSIQRGDQILFHYSGHGSQMPAKPEDYEPDGLNETISPYDTRTDGIYDIPDKTLAALLDSLAAAKGDQIIVILDSCHSGSATRDVEDPAAVGVRRVPADERIPPADLDADLLDRAKAVSRDAGPSGWVMADTPYVLLAGCRDREESNEYEAEIESGERVSHGALTYFALKVLRQMPEGASYAEWHERVVGLVNAIYPHQTPQCEGDRYRQIFGDTRVQRVPFVPVQEVDGDFVTLKAGLVHGLRPGTRLAIYPPEVRTRADLPLEPLATVEVTSVTATTAQAEIQDIPDEPIPEHARGLITRQVYTGMSQTVALEATEGDENRRAIEALRQSIRTAGPGGQESPYLQVVDDPTQQVDLRVKTEAGKLGIYNGNYELLVLPEDIEAQDQSGSDGVDRAATAVRRSLESIVRYRTLAKLENEGQSQLNGKLRLRLRRYVAGAPPEPLEPGTIEPGGDITLYYDPDRRERNLYVVDVINKSDLEVYPHVFTLSPDYSISLLYPTLGQQEVVQPNSEDNPFAIGMQQGTTQLRIWLPEGWDASRDQLKAIVSTVPTDLQMLKQEGINVPLPRADATSGREPSSTLEQLLSAVAFGAGTRFSGPEQTLETEDWTVVELPFKTVRKYAATRLDLPQGRIRLSEELTLVKPEGFTGEVTVTTLGLAIRGGAGDPSLRPPPGLECFPDLFEPVGRSGTRSIGPTSLVVGLDVDEASRRLIASDNPLRLELSPTRSDEAANLLPVVFDGEDYLLAGYGAEDGNAVELVSLPLPVTALAADGQPAMRGIGRMLRLFIYKKLGRYISDVGLRSAELEVGKVVYRDVQHDRFRSGHKVAIFVHDFSSDTRWMIEQLAQFLRKEVRAYDHLLTWDYETFGTGVEDNGEQLALALKRQCGFYSDDGITVDIYTHGMGAIISRCMIELSGGHEFVDQVVLAGPPNQGSTLASTGRGLLFLLTTLLNFASLVPILGVGSKILQQLYEQSSGIADLAVDSPTLNKLNGLEEPSNVPYLVLAGENQSDGKKNRLDRIAHKVLDKGLDAIFGEQNDLVVGLSSMRNLRGGMYPNLKVEVLSCDHFHYYVVPEGQQAIKR